MFTLFNHSRPNSAFTNMFEAIMIVELEKKYDIYSIAV